MSAAADTLLALAIYNSWRRGDETIEMPAPAEIGATIDDAVNLLRKHDGLERELAAERGKVRTLHAACETICEEWGRNHDANPIGAGQRMATRASDALEKVEDAT